MFFSRLELNNGIVAKQKFWQAFRNPYTLHQSVWRLFADNNDRERDFLYRLDTNSRQPVVYALSSRSPLSDELWNVQTKTFHPALREGMHLAFSLRVNPTIKKEGKRHDVVMEAKRKMRAGVSPPQDRALLIQEECVRWLEKRSQQKGFALKAVLADCYQVHQFRKPNSGSRVSFATCDLQGILEVREPATFEEALYRGMGPSKGFGCGLLMIRCV